MRSYSILESLVKNAKLRALGYFYNGKVTPEARRRMAENTHLYVINPELSAVIIYTRDIGHHTSGWWKNPDYERCYHLSISFVTPDLSKLPFNKALGLKIAEAFFDQHAPKLWLEGPYSPEGKARDVWHYRLFADEQWNPIQPRGEVYSKDQTPKDWKSFSEVHGISLDQVDAPFLTEAQ